MTVIAKDLAPAGPHPYEGTLASCWSAAAGTALTNEPLDWPPDWSDGVVDAGRRWDAWVEDARNSLPAVLAHARSVVVERSDLPLDDLADGQQWRVCEALLTVHPSPQLEKAIASIGAVIDGGHTAGRPPLIRRGAVAPDH